jgi:uncharacterized membrane-anchored protein
MKNKKILACLIIAILFQASVLVGEYVSSVYPHWTGKEIILKMRPVDPRSMFRGQYVNLNYEINSLSSELMKEIDTSDQTLRQGEIVYVSLKENDGIWEASSVNLSKPLTGMFIQGRIHRRWRGSTVSIKYGIEAYFASPKRAKEIENSVRKESRNGKAFAIVMIASNGKAALKEIAIK